MEMFRSALGAAPVPSITRTCSRMTLGVPTRTYLRTSGERASKRWAHASGDKKRPSRQERSSEVAIRCLPGSCLRDRCLPDRCLPGSECGASFIVTRWRATVVSCVALHVALIPAPGAYLLRKQQAVCDTVAK